MPTIYILPGGLRRHIIIGATAGNVITNLTPPVMKGWKVLHGRITLVTNASEANRILRFRTTDGVNDIQAYPRCALAQTASLTWFYSYNPVAQHLGGIGDDALHVALGELILWNPDQIRLDVVAGVAGDSYYGEIAVLEFDTV